ncbi:ATP-binding protein [Streptomyces cinnabarinus]|uniref:ATP-binding protein n=1 Tax=Streptomyces cinnabarinus TaxID=67287 RepID=A0ABY7KEA8_9ACTN|nr:ATP-binding protein [Streptomyces cinnabarinus]WAZ22015.1 ATP-binding protein [Streptomyces cinnabarinus]
MNHDNCVPRKGWEVPFQAAPREVPALRRIMRLHLTYWGLLGVLEDAQLCVTELATNVVKHVGLGAPAVLAVCMNGTKLHLEVQDPHADAVPTLDCAGTHDERGRGLALVDAMSERWGVRRTSAGKATWCELATTLTSPNGHVQDQRVSRADGLLSSYDAHVARFTGAGVAPLDQAAKGAASLIVDLLCWTQAHGLDPELLLEEAQESFEVASLGRHRCSLGVT